MATTKKPPLTGSSRSKPKPPYIAYAEGVVAGKIPACGKTFLACKRFLSDFAAAKKKDSIYVFDTAEVEDLAALISTFIQQDDRFAGKPIDLQPFQWFLIANLFGFKRRADGLRRFRKAYISMARQNGKSFLIACLSIIFLLSCNGGQIYSAATTREQAKITLDHARAIVENTPSLTAHLEVLTNSIICKRRASSFRALSSDVRNKDGKAASFAIFDEVGAYRHCNLINVIESGMKSKSEFMSVYITTANQWATDQPGFLVYEYAGRVLSGEIEDDQFFACVWELDQGDDWKKAANYKKANPNLGLTVKIEDIEQSIKEAQARPELEWELRTKIANTWQKSAQASYINDDKYIIAIENEKKFKAKLSEEILKKAPVGIGIDLAGRNDLACFTLAFYLDDPGMYYLRHRVFIPAPEIENKIKNDSHLFRQWVANGLVHATPGPVNDLNNIAEEILRDVDAYSCRYAFYDPKMSQDVIDKLQETIDVVPIPQTLALLSEPTKDLLELHLTGRIIDGSPVARWCANNAVLYQSNGMIKVNKLTKDSPRKIDTLASSIMAVMACKQAQKRPKEEAGPKIPDQEILSILFPK